jgi:hypothetical protein
MTHDEIIEMAQECKLIGMRPHLDGIYSEALIAFANLVATKEREACAKECEHTAQESDSFTESILRATATQIRARGEQA